MCDKLGALTTASSGVLLLEACPWAALTHNHKSLFNMARDLSIASGVSGPKEKHTSPRVLSFSFNASWYTPITWSSDRIHDNPTVLLRECEGCTEPMGVEQHVVCEQKPFSTLRDEGELRETEQNSLTSALQPFKWVQCFLLTQDGRK